IGEWCDLLPHVDPIRHALEGEWKCDDSRLVAASNARPAVLAVPLIPTGAYEIDVTFTPGFDRVPVQLYRNEMQYKNRFHDFRLTLPLGETFIKLGVVKDASSDFVRALLDGENKPLKFPGAWSRFRVHPYENPAASRLRVRVIPQGERASVEVWSDRKRLVRWEGLLRDLPQFGDADSEPRCLRIESPDGGCEVYELELRPLSGTVRLGVQ
ncbi:MAG TPA: hypothetical protein VGE52_06570, partial [Pirellulales bacterium]